MTDMATNCYCMEKCKNYFQNNIKAYAVKSDADLT